MMISSCDTTKAAILNNLFTTNMQDVITNISVEQKQAKNEKQKFETLHKTSIWGK